MSEEYIHFFSGSIIEANHLTTKLSENKIKSVSYTHLTLPTILLV